MFKKISALVFLFSSFVCGVPDENYERPTMVGFQEHLKKRINIAQKLGKQEEVEKLSRVLSLVKGDLPECIKTILDNVYDLKEEREHAEVKRIEIRRTLKKI